MEVALSFRCNSQNLYLDELLRLPFVGTLAMRFISLTGEDKVI